MYAIHIFTEKPALSQKYCQKPPTAEDLLNLLTAVNLTVITIKFFK